MQDNDARNARCPNGCFQMETNGEQQATVFGLMVALVLFASKVISYLYKF